MNDIDDNNINSNNNNKFNIQNWLKQEFKLIEVVIVMLITIVIGIIIGYAVTSKFENENSKLVQNDEYLQEFIDTYEEIQEEYYEETDKKELINNAINGMLQTLGDPYSMYMSEEVTETFNERLYGDYTGIGAEISMTEDGKVIIYSTFEDSPAEKAGLQFGDVIVKIDDEDMEGKTSSDVSKLIKGISGTKVKLTINRDGKEYTYEITRATVVLDSVTSKVYEANNKKIGYINISIFAANSYAQFKNELEKLENEKIDSLIIDVRNNTGGYLDVVTNMLSMLLKKDSVIYQLDDKGEITKIKDETKESRKYDIAVLINEYSASASEILAAAIKENYGGEVIGVNSYGKGTVQETKELSTGGMMKFTTQKWLTPNGNWINETGVDPTITVELQESYDENDESTDNQLQKAIEQLSK